MSNYTSLAVAFHCGDNEPVAQLARKYYPMIEAARQEPEWRGRAGWGGRWEATEFLRDLGSRTGKNHGPKGGLGLWGMVGKDTSADEFTSVLRPFWEELLRAGLEEGPLRTDHILVFWQSENDLFSGAIEISLQAEHPWDLGTGGELRIKRHTGLPFTWSHQQQGSPGREPLGGAMSG